MDLREIRAERACERIAIGHERRFARQPMSGRNAGQPFHHEVLASDDTSVTTEEQRLGRRDAGVVRDAQHRELLRAGQARGDGGRRVGAQHQRVRAAKGTVRDVDVEQEIVLDRAAGQPLVARHANVVRAHLAFEPAGEGGRFGRIHDVLAQRFRHRLHVCAAAGRSPRRMRRAML